MDDNEEEREEDGRVDDPWEDGEGIAMKTATLTVGGELEWSSVIELFVEIEGGLFPLSADDEAELGIGFKNILARVSKEGVVETSAVRRFPSSSPVGVGAAGMGTGDERLGLEPVQVVGVA